MRKRGGRHAKIPRTRRQRTGGQLLRGVRLNATKALITGAAVFAAGLAYPPPGHASADLVAGMAITIGRHGCTLGFFGQNQRSARLAVTAGHCSDQIPDQLVYADNGVEIGHVVAWKPDYEDRNGKLTGSRGYTVFQVYDRFSLNLLFTDIGVISEGDSVRKIGRTSKDTGGHITEIRNHPKRRDLEVMFSDMVQLPGDSGGPWYTTGPTLIGIGSSGDQQDQGGGAGSQGQPIGALIDMIRANPSGWGDNFRVWTR